MYSVNPQSFINTHHSALRNMIITQAAALTLFGYSNKSEISKRIFLYIAYLLIIISCIIGYLAANQLKILIDDIKNDNNLPNIYVKLIPEWNKWYYITLIFVISIFIIGTSIFISKIF